MVTLAHIVADEDTSDDSMENLCLNLCKVLSRALQDVCNRHATEHALRSKASIAIRDMCDDIVFEKLTEWSGRTGPANLYNEAALLKHKKMVDIMTREKDGTPKENTFLPWCRRIDKLRAQVTSDSPATEYAETVKEQENRYFTALAYDVLSNDLTPEQQKNDAYKIRRNKDTGKS